MPNPVYIPIIFFIGIILGLFLKKSRNLTVLLLFLIFLSLGIIPLLGFWKVFFYHYSPTIGQFFGMAIPQLILDGHRLLLLGIINLTGFFSGIFLLHFFQSKTLGKLVLYLLFFLSVDLLIMSNSILIMILFVIIAQISLYGLILQSFDSKEKHKLQILFLVATALLITGLLMLFFSKSQFDFSEISNTANFFFFSGFFLIFGVAPLTSPLNKGSFAEKGIFLLLFQGVFLSAAFFVFYLLSQSVTNLSILNAFAIIGLLTYFFSSFMATGSVSVSKIVSYNTTGQFGLMISIIGMSRYLGIDSFYILASIFLTHFFAKAGILWLAADMTEDNITKWFSLRKKIVLLFLFGIFVFALIGFPPFSSFFARWKLLTHLLDYKMYGWIILFGLGFLLEMYYLLRWVAGISKKEKNPHFTQASSIGWISASFSFIFLLVVSNFSLLYLNNVGDLQLFILVFIFLLFLLSFTPPIVQFIFSLGFLTNIYFLMKFPLSNMQLILISIIVLFAILLLISNLKRYKHQRGLNAIVLLMAWGAIMLIIATQWTTVVLWVILLVAGIFLFALHKNNLKNKSLFFILAAMVGIITTSIGLFAVINQTGSGAVVDFSWETIAIIPKILIISGTTILIIAILIIVFSSFGKKTQVSVDYFSFRNILAEAIELFLSSQILFSLIQILLVVGIFGLLVFGNFF